MIKIPKRNIWPELVHGMVPTEDIITNRVIEELNDCSSIHQAIKVLSNVAVALSVTSSDKI